jgi:hypothetical protein
MLDESFPREPLGGKRVLSAPAGRPGLSQKRHTLLTAFSPWLQFPRSDSNALRQAHALMTSNIYSLSREVREAALDLKAVQKRIREADHRAYEWYPAQANARARMVALSRARGADFEQLGRQPETPAEDAAPDPAKESENHET